MERTIFYVSDGTGITAETIGHTLLTQFPGVTFKQIRVPFVDTVEAAEKCRERIVDAAGRDGQPPIVINTVIDPGIHGVLSTSPGLVLDLFDTFLGQLEAELGIPRSPSVGQAHGLVDYATYETRMEATNFALQHDDGARLQFDKADAVLLGVSRSGKTPTCLYMALQFGVRAANYPLTEEDLGDHQLPESVRDIKHKLFGLSIDSDRLHQIREARRPGSRYASLRQCRTEVEEAENMFTRYGIPSLNTTHTSVEEIASKVMLQLGLEKQLF